MTFSLTIVAIDREIFAGQAQALTVPSLAGELQILAEHAPLISLLKEGNLIVQREVGNEQTIPIAGGVLEVKEKEVVALVKF